MTWSLPKDSVLFGPGHVDGSQGCDKLILTHIQIRRSRHKGIMHKPPGMKSLNIGQVLWARFKEEEQDQSLLQSAWDAWELSRSCKVFEDCSEVVEEDNGEVCRPRWMSRKVLNAQLRQQPRPSPVGFKMRRRADRRAQAQGWLQGFLEVFCADSGWEAEGLLKASRRRPANDKNQPDNSPNDETRPDDNNDGQDCSQGIYCQGRGSHRDQGDSCQGRFPSHGFVHGGVDSVEIVGRMVERTLQGLPVVLKLPIALCLEINSYLAPVIEPRLLHRVVEGGPVTYPFLGGHRAIPFVTGHALQHGKVSSNKKHEVPPFF
jgi:hypothetical protein